MPSFLVIRAENVDKDLRFAALTAQLYGFYVKHENGVLIAEMRTISEMFRFKKYCTELFFGSDNIPINTDTMESAFKILKECRNAGK